MPVVLFVYNEFVNFFLDLVIVILHELYIYTNILVIFHDLLQ